MAANYYPIVFKLIYSSSHHKRITFNYSSFPIRTVDAFYVIDFPLTEVDEVGVEEDAHHDQDDQQAQLLVGLLQCVEQGLQASKVTDQLEDPENPHDSNQSEGSSVNLIYMIFNFSIDP